MKHLAVIMDGNRRWAKQRGLRPWLGHRQGAESIKRIVDFCLKKGISYLSLYTFSLENFRRPESELSFLFDLIKHESLKQLDLFLKYGVRVRFVGDRSLFPDSIKPTIEKLETETGHLTNLNLNFLFCYGARQEIVGGIKKLLSKVKDGVLAEQDISEEAFSECLWTAGMPEPELIIRTGGAVRLSNFLLFQAAYSEFYFLDCLWPEIEEKHLLAAYQQFEDCKRNFGS
ncbi:MAG: polyprenyl diphosphate synthase [Candidatus Babeliales bacterium]